jgi:hypothetical protein
VHFVNLSVVAACRLAIHVGQDVTQLDFQGIAQVSFTRENRKFYSFYRFITRSIATKNQQISFKPEPSSNPVLSLRHES